MITRELKAGPRGQQKNAVVVLGDEVSRMDKHELYIHGRTSNIPASQQPNT